MARFRTRIVFAMIGIALVVVGLAATAPYMNP